MGTTLGMIIGSRTSNHDEMSEHNVHAFYLILFPGIAKAAREFEELLAGERLIKGCRLKRIGSASQEIEVVLQKSGD